MRDVPECVRIRFLILVGVIASRTYVFTTTEGGDGRLSLSNQFFNSVVLSFRLM